MKRLPKDKVYQLQKGGLFVPCPLALNERYQLDEAWQRLLILYYIQAGARAVIPGAHTGEFALNDLDVYAQLLQWTKEMSRQYGNENLLLIAAVGGPACMQQVELAAIFEYDLVMVAPTAFHHKSPQQVHQLLEIIASIIPFIGFELQRAIPGAYEYNKDIWEVIFSLSYGAKGASFDTYRSLAMLEAAACSSRKEELCLLTGNDDRIVHDLSATFYFDRIHSVQYQGGLLGHFATDTFAAGEWVKAVLKYRSEQIWDFPLSQAELSQAVDQCNMALFDALNNFKNSIWGVKYRLSKLGLLTYPYCKHEKGNSKQAKTIDRSYSLYPELTDNRKLLDLLADLKNEVGINPE